MQRIVALVIAARSTEPIVVEHVARSDEVQSSECLQRRGVPRGSLLGDISRHAKCRTEHRPERRVVDPTAGKHYLDRDFSALDGCSLASTQPNGTCGKLSRATSRTPIPQQSVDLIAGHCAGFSNTGQIEQSRERIAQY